MRRRIRISGILLLVSGVGWLIPASGGAAAPEEEQKAWHPSGSASDQSWSRRNCKKQKGTAKARRSCRQKKHGRKAPTVAAPDQSNSVPQVPLAAPPAPIPPIEEVPDPDERGEPAPPPPPPPKKGPPKKPWPEEPPFPGIPNCEIVEGDCSIYSDKFWELLARYKRFEIGFGEYPTSPHCMEAQEAGKDVGCPAAIYVLYPDGTLGGGGWVVDPCAPNGWREWEPDPPPCPPSEEAAEG